MLLITAEGKNAGNVSKLGKLKNVKSASGLYFATISLVEDNALWKQELKWFSSVLVDSLWEIIHHEVYRTEAFCEMESSVL